MKSEQPWIDAVLETFPANDPQNEQRRELLLEAAHAVPFEAPSDEPPAPPRFKNSRRARMLRSGLFLLGLWLLWVLLLCPTARRRLQGISLCDRYSDRVSPVTLSFPLPYYYRAREGQQWQPWVEDFQQKRHPADKLLLRFGKSHEPDEAIRWRELWSSHPEDPVCFAERFRATAFVDSDPDPSLLTEAAEADPGNGYYDLLTAIHLAGSCVDESYSRSKSGHRSREWKITDPERAELAWQHLERALDASRIESHAFEMIELRLEGWPKPREYPDFAADEVTATAYLRFDRPFPLGTRELAGLFVTRAKKLAAAGDTTELRKLCRLVRKTVQLIHRAPVSSWSMNTASILLGNAQPGMLEACQIAGLTEEAAFWADFATYRSKQGTAFTSRFRPDHASSLWWHATADLDSGRHAEQRMFEGLYLGHAALVFLVFSGMASFLHRHSFGRLLQLPGRISPLLRFSDYARIILIGVGLPALIVVATLELPILNPRDQPMDGFQACAVLQKLLSLIVAALFLTTRETGLALTRRATPLGFRPMARTPLLLLGLLALAGAPSASALSRIEDFGPLPREWVWAGFFMLPGLLLVAFLVGIGVLVFTGHRRLQATTLLRCLTPPLLTAAWLMVAWSGVNRCIERHHVRHATAERIDSPQAILFYQGNEPGTYRQIMEDYLATAPE
ncbi:hypothetical protein [Haloferula sargassicola]|uniref:Uncharacterized protein n=1 Tax=Haloferula sargassicola TaxID=490096 RepID=A0ABP9UL20_9BACT